MTIRMPRWNYWAAWGAAAFYNFCRDAFGMPWRYLAVFNLTHFFLWGCLGLLALPLVRRHPIRLHWRPWVLHLLAGSAFTLVDITLGHWITFRALGVGRSLDLLGIAKMAFRDCFHLGLLTYWAMVGLMQGLDTLRRSRQRDLLAAQLETRLLQSQLQSLKMQLQPHFLFNTLSAVASIMHYDVKTADRMLTRLSDVLRLSLAQAGDQVLSLKQELDFVRAYLEIEQIRFEDRLQVRVDVPEALLDFPVPPFLLQPLVENAIKHAIAPRAEGGVLVIRARREGSELRLEVEDDGPALLPRQGGFGIGLRNTCSRLEHLYGPRSRFELVREGMGTVARILLPEAPAGEAAA